MANRWRRRPPFFGLLLIVLGVVLLLQTLNVIRSELWLEIWRFWPVLLVIIGANLLLDRRLPWLAALIATALVIGSIAGAALYAEAEREWVINKIAEPLDGTKHLVLNMDVGPSSLKIDALPERSSNMIEGSFETFCRSYSTSLIRDGEVAHLDVELEGSVPFCPWGIDAALYLSRVPEVSLNLRTSASSADLDLTELKVYNLNLNASAADLDIKTPENADDVFVVIEANAANIDVEIPDSVAALIYNDADLSSFSLSSRFQILRSRSSLTDSKETIGGRDLSDVFMSPGYRDAENRVNIELDVNLSNVTVR